MTSTSPSLKVLPFQPSGEVHEVELDEEVCFACEEEVPFATEVAAAGFFMGGRPFFPLRASLMHFRWAAGVMSSSASMVARSPPSSAATSAATCVDFLMEFSIGSVSFESKTTFNKKSFQQIRKGPRVEFGSKGHLYNLRVVVRPGHLDIANHLDVLGGNHLDVLGVTCAGQKRDARDPKPTEDDYRLRLRR